MGVSVWVYTGHKLLSEVMCLSSCDDVIDRTQVRRGPPDSSPQQTGTSRTVKRYPSSSGPIISNALPNGNGYANGHGPEHRNWHGHRNGHSNVHSFNTHRPASDSQLNAQFNNALSPAGKKRICVYCTFWNEYHENLDLYELYMHSILNISALPSHIKTNTSHSGEAIIHTYTSCGVIAKWNISRKEKNWQHPRHFPSPTVHPPHPICGLRHTIQTNIWYQSCMHCVNMHMCVCVCVAGPQTFICWRGLWAPCVFLCVCAVTCFDIFGNLHCHLSDMTGTEPWRLYPQQNEMGI